MNAELMTRAQSARWTAKGSLMANGRNPKKRGHDSSRDAGGFVALSWALLEGSLCLAWRW